MQPVAQMVVGSPSGARSTVDLHGPAMLVGRPVPGHRPDIALDPDPRLWVGREHCSLRMTNGAWTVVDEGTVNGTMLLRDGEYRRLDEPTRLRDGDELLVLGDVTGDGEPCYWRLTFRDPHATQRAFRVDTAPAPAGGPPCVEYDWSSAIVYLHRDGQRTEVTGLRPQAHDLVRHMMGRARDERTSSVMCTHSELLTALFGDPGTWRSGRAHTEQDIRDVVSDVRKAIEPDRAHPIVLQTVRGKGYRLVAWMPPGG